MITQPNQEITEQALTREHLGLVIGDDPQMQEMWRQMRLSARSNRPTLVLGEIGSGKELVARAIAEMHLRLKKGNIEDIGILNSTAISEQLVEAELFGHTKGSFTGADDARKGEFEEHKNGAVILDEIGDLAWLLQAKILRVLEEPNTFRPVGSNRDHTFEGKVVASTHQDLNAFAEERTFRKDLLSRLGAGGVIRVPSLNVRAQSHILQLIDFFVSRMQGKLGQITMTAGAREHLLTRPYPNNVRDLRNTVESACIAAVDSGRSAVYPQDITSIGIPSPTIVIATQPTNDFDSSVNPSALDKQLDATEKGAIETSLIKNKFSRTKTATELGISRVTLYNKMKKYGMLNADNTATNGNHTVVTPRKPR